MFAGTKLFERHARRVRGQHRHERDAARVRVAEDPVPAEPCERRLQSLEEAAQDDVADGDLGEGVPQFLEPADDVDPRELQEDEDDERPDDPRCDPPQLVLLRLY